MKYTARVDGFQIIDPVYIGRPPKDAPVTYDVVKWEEYGEPTKCWNMVTHKITEETEYCYVVARLVWDRKEGCLDFNSIGLRWLEARPSDEVVQMVLDFCEYVTPQLRNDDD